MANIFNPFNSKKRVALWIAPRYRPRSLQEFLTNSLFNANIVRGQQAYEFLEKLRDQEGISREEWQSVLKDLDATVGQFYFNIRKKLLGAGMVTFSKNRYIISTEFGTILEWINSLWQAFTGYD